MLMKKRVLTSIMAITLVISLSVPAFAATYTDLTNHWAKTYMESLATSGYLTGYSDGTMKPDKNITYCEALTLLSRLYSFNDLQKDTIEADYGTVVKASVPTTLSWAYTNIEVCLAAGILTESELKSVDLTTAITREQMSVYLIRAVQLTFQADALSGVTLTFADAGSISSACVGSIAELVTIGVVQGDDNNNFSPKSTVTRAVVAAMVYRSLDYIKTKGITLSIAAYAGLSQTEGIIRSVNGSTFEICGFDGLTRSYTLSSTGKVTVNGIAGSLSLTYSNSKATVTTKSGAVTNLAIESATSVDWVQGTVSSISTSSSSGTLTVLKIDTSVVTTYNVPSNAIITRAGATATFTSIVKSDFVTMKLVGDTVSEVYAISGDKTLAGTVSEVKYGTTISLKIEDSTGIMYSFQFAISALPTITRGDATVTIDRIKAGGTVTLTIDDAKVTKIVIEGSANTISGVVTSITTSTGGTAWVIKNSSGTTASYTLDEDVTAYSGTTEISISKIAVGDTVTAEAYEDVITLVKLESSVNSTTKVSGAVLEVNTSTAIVTILTSENKLVYISVRSTASIINAKTGSSFYYSSIPVGSSLVAYGEYADSRNFTAKSIIIE
ncbi:MAG: S-layer homology domain-containing protein [Oscillospiraceae bacterium]|nr:S-layer homology domain-containing protein [Oscillospiraceae bacterium]